jgi:hypothetical protein
MPINFDKLGERNPADTAIDPTVQRIHSTSCDNVANIGFGDIAGIGKALDHLGTPRR